MTNLKIGKVTHFYDKIGVAVIELSSSLSVGDKVKISKKDQEFEQAVKSIQQEHKQVKTAKKGETIGLKVDKPVPRNAEVYKIS